jgi:hypothetical protein
MYTFGYNSYRTKLCRKYIIKTAERSTENMAEFRYLETPARNNDFFSHDEIKRRLNSGNVY